MDNTNNPISNIKKNHKKTPEDLVRERRVRDKRNIHWAEIKAERTALKRLFDEMIDQDSHVLMAHSASKGLFSIYMRKYKGEYVFPTDSAKVQDSTGDDETKFAVCIIQS